MARYVAGLLRLYKQLGDRSKHSRPAGAPLRRFM